MPESLKLSDGFWRDRRVLITGHTGFKGAWLAVWLTRLGAKVTGVSLPPDSYPSLYEMAGVRDDLRAHFEQNIQHADTLAEVVQRSEPEIVFHLAAQSLVRESYRQPIDTFATNVMGTANLLNAMRSTPSIRVAVMVTTDKVYLNREWHYPYREDDRLGGHDPYSASKACCELLVDAWRNSFLQAGGVRVATARAGNVIGGGDWSVDRLFPDAVRAWSSGNVLSVRHPGSIRPWQHVLDPLAGYITLARSLWEGRVEPGPFNFGPDAVGSGATVGQVARMAGDVWGGGEVALGLSPTGFHEAKLLTLDTSNTRNTLGYEPVWGLPESVRRTISWYRRALDGASARSLCEEDIDAFQDAMG